MRIFPAVDVLGGRCVQLVQGDRERATGYGDPLGCARQWVNEGADALHVINLDGAFGESSRNAEIIRGIVNDTGVYVELGGGIRSVADAASWLGTGVGRVILGTLAVRRPEAITTLSDEFGSERVMAGVDARNGEVVVEGWRENAGDYLHWAKVFEEMGAGSLLFTNVDVEGLCQGIRIEPVRRLVGGTSLPVTVAGGVTGVGDILALCGAGVDGAVLGSALYSGKIMLAEALEAARRMGVT